MTKQYTGFVFLDPKQQREFRLKWEKVREAVTRWADQTPGAEIRVFSGSKVLEKEIDDLEDISLAAYRAMKLLKKQLEEKNMDFDYSNYSG